MKSIKTTIQKQNIWILSPLFGSLLYALLYFVASLYYPGGSQFDKNSIGFSWTQNYWCNLLNENAINGQLNAARPIAFFALFVLYLTLVSFWWLFPQYAQLNNKVRLAIQISGIISMTTGFFLFTSLHDTIINIATVLGLVAVAGTFYGLLILNWKKLFWMGTINILLIIANNVLYNNSELIYLLPLVQKISFAYFLLWICFISLCLYRRQNN